MSPNDVGYDSRKYKSASLAYLLLVVNVFFLYVRPQETLSFIQPLRLPGLLSMGLLAWLVFNVKPYLFKDVYIRRIFILIVIFGLASIGARNVVGYRIVINWSTAYVPVVAALYLLACTEARYKSFLGWWSIIHFLVALKVIETGGHGPGDFLWDENDVSLGLGMAMPIVFYMSRWQGITTFQKNMLLLFSFIIMVAIVVTQSRGGMLGLFSVFGTMWLFSKRKFTILSIGLLVAITGSGIIYSLLPDGFLEDLIAGLTDSNDSTRVERFRSWEIAWMMFLDNFFTGVGPGNFPWNVGIYQTDTSWWYDGARSLEGRQVHSMYFEIIADVGLIGTFAYYSIIVMAMRRCIQIQKRLKEKLESEKEVMQYNLALICRGLVVSMACYLVSGAFISVSYYPHAIFWIAICAITFREYSYQRGATMDVKTNV